MPARRSHRWSSAAAVSTSHASSTRLRGAILGGATAPGTGVRCLQQSGAAGMGCPDMIELCVSSAAITRTPPSVQAARRRHALIYWFGPGRTRGRRRSASRQSESHRRGRASVRPMSERACAPLRRPNWLFLRQRLVGLSMLIEVINVPATVEAHGSPGTEKEALLIAVALAVVGFTVTVVAAIRSERRRARRSRRGKNGSAGHARRPRS